MHLRGIVIAEQVAKSSDGEERQHAETALIRFVREAEKALAEATMMAGGR